MPAAPRHLAATLNRDRYRQPAYATVGSRPMHGQISRFSATHTATLADHKADRNGGYLRTGRGPASITQRDQVSGAAGRAITRALGLLHLRQVQLHKDHPVMD